MSENPVNDTTKVLDFVEYYGKVTRYDILTRMWRHITSEELDQILSTLVEGQIFEEVKEGRKVSYRMKGPIWQTRNTSAPTVGWFVR